MKFRFNHRIFNFSLCLLIVLLISTTTLAQEGKFEWGKITSPALEGNLIGDSATRSFAVYLPPSYETIEKRYPVIYLLHGYGGSPGGYTNIKPNIDSMIKNGDIGEIIVVFVDGANRFGGSFYRNSETIGDYEGYITTDLVNHIDSNYRTIAHRNSRGITGHSMGGYGCMHLALTYPDVFSAVVAQGGLYKNDSDYMRNLLIATAADTKDWGEFSQLFWMTQAAYALTAALAPNPNNPPFYLDKAFKMMDGKAQVVPEVWDSFIKNDIVDSELSHYLEQPLRLNGIMFAHGSSDGIVPVSQAQALDKAMTELGIEHVYDEHRGGHEFTASKSLHFLSEHLSFSLPKQEITSIQPQGKGFVTWGKVKQDRLMQNYPNPFNPETWIPYQLGKATDVVIKIHTASGQLVRTLNPGHKSAGTYINRDKAAYWDGKNEVGELISSEIYFYTIEAGDFTAIRKMVIAK